MPRAVLIVAAAVTGLSFLLAGRIGGGMVRRHGRILRLLAFLTVETFLGVCLFRPASASCASLSVCYLCASLSVLMQPVPPGKVMRLNVLAAACLPVPFLYLFLPRASLPALAFLPLLSRMVLARRRMQSLEAQVRSHSYRKALQQADRSDWEMLWSFLLLGACLSDGVPYAGPLVTVVSVLLYLWLDIRWCFGTPFFCMRPLEERVTRLLSTRTRIPASGQECGDRELYERCCRYMTERRAFLVESYSLLDLASAMYTNKVYLSKTINEFSHKNFRQWINQYRIHYSMELFRQNMSLKVVDLAELSGFHSTTTYTMAFKVLMEESPSVWCKRMRFRRLTGRSAPSEEEEDG